MKDILLILAIVIVVGFFSTSKDLFKQQEPTLTKQPDLFFKPPKDYEIRSTKSGRSYFGGMERIGIATITPDGLISIDCPNALYEINDIDKLSKKEAQWILKQMVHVSMHDTLCQDVPKSMEQYKIGPLTFDPIVFKRTEE